MSRKLLVAGNWKMNKTISETVDFLNGLNPTSEKDVLICPPSTALSAAVKAAIGKNISIGAQNMHFEEKGAFTGEISPLMLKDIGVTYVILGHSERRHVFLEDDLLINKKVKSAIAHGLNPILCVGETLDEREAGKTNEVIEQQIKEGLKEVDGSKVIIAYEPVWAIGTGKTASPEHAEEIHKFIRSLINSEVRILYGGSVTPDNSKELLSKEDIDGALIGGASLSIEKFSEILD